MAAFTAGPEEEGGLGQCHTAGAGRAWAGRGSLAQPPDTGWPPGFPSFGPQPLTSPVFSPMHGSSLSMSVEFP